MKTSELSGSMLDWAVAKCVDEKLCSLALWPVSKKAKNMPVRYRPSSDERQGKPIIDREGIAVETEGTAFRARCASSEATGPTKLIAAMRAFVMNRLGQTVATPTGIYVEVIREPRREESPSPDEIRSARQAAALTQTEAGAIVHTTCRVWQQWEGGERQMHPAFWELFRIKSATRIAHR